MQQNYSFNQLLALTSFIQVLLNLQFVRFIYRKMPN